MAMDEYTGAQLGGEQWGMLHQEAEMDHPDHENTDAGLCPICFEEVTDGQ